jgi:predicted AlkP superfamily phosphohydrolase/phosphomutase
MKICVIGLDGAVPELVFQDERLVNLRRLVDAGLYGMLQGAKIVSPDSAFTVLTMGQVHNSAGAQSIAELLMAKGKKAVVVSESEAVQSQVAVQDWDYFQFIDLGLREISYARPHTGAEESASTTVTDYHLSFDEQVGKVMELLDDQTILLVVLASGSQNQDDPPSGLGLFLLAAPNCPIGGEHEGARLVDIAPTLLDLAGYEIPASMQGRSLVAGMEKRVPTEEDHEKIIYDRLAGLGYV